MGRLEASQTDGHQPERLGALGRFNYISDLVVGLVAQIKTVEFDDLVANLELTDYVHDAARYDMRHHGPKVAILCGLVATNGQAQGGGVQILPRDGYVADLVFLVGRRLPRAGGIVC